MRMKYQREKYYVNWRIYLLYYLSNWRIADIVEEKNVKSLIPRTLGMRFEINGKCGGESEKETRDGYQRREEERVLDLTRIDKDHLLFFGNFWLFFSFLFPFLVLRSRRSFHSNKKKKKKKKKSWPFCIISPPFLFYFGTGGVSILYLETKKKEDCFGFFFFFFQRIDV